MKNVLLIDIGNTSIKIGIAPSSALGELCTYSLPSFHAHSSDSLGLYLLDVLRHKGLNYQDIEACLVSSVVPGLDPLIQAACQRFLHLQPLLVPSDLPLSIENKYEKPSEVGADRLLAAFAARKAFPEPASIISVDFGTATTFDCVSGNAYLGGLICPGVLSSHEALASRTAKLPRMALEVAQGVPLIGANTATSMTHGFVFGFACLTEGLCQKLKEQLPGPVFVVGTGGFAKDVIQVSSCLDALRPDLVLEGLRHAWLDSTIKPY